jgi:hypothetical protein
VLLRSWVAAQFYCDQSAVAMRLCAGLTSAKLALLSRSSTTSRTGDSEYLFWTEFSFHGGEILPQTHVQKMVNPEQLWQFLTEEYCRPWCHSCLLYTVTLASFGGEDPGNEGTILDQECTDLDSWCHGRSPDVRQRRSRARGIF